MIDSKLRLNADIRADIIDNALVSSGVVAEERAIIEARSEFCADVVAFELNRQGLTQNKLREQYKQEEAASNSFIYVSVGRRTAHPGGYSYTPVNLCGMSISLYPNGAFEGGVNTHLTPENTPRLKSPEDGGDFYPRAQVTIADPAWQKRWLSLDARADAVANKRKELEATLTATLRKYKTVGTLLAAWPEAKDLLPKGVIRATGTGVALSTETLNAICGLPK